MNASRRHFLRASVSLAATPSVQRASAPLVMSLAGMAALASQGSVAANTGNGYRALVCLFMAGGNDGHNWVVPIDATGYAQYANVRRELAWPAAKLLPITSHGQAVGRAFGMPEELQPLRQWYESGRTAIVANVGPLVRPISVADYKAGVGLPARLYSHNDQQSTWQSLSPEGARSGWGGRMGDILMSANPYPVFTAVSATGNAVFLTGSSVTQYQVGPDGPVSVRALGAASSLGSVTAPRVLQNSLVSSGNTAMQAEYVRVMQRAIASDAVLQAALQTASVPAVPGTPITDSNPAATLDKDNLARQLRMVAQMIGAGQAMGMRRQVFMVQIGGFDSHNNQMRDQPVLMSRVAQSASYFLSAIETMGLLDKVMLFSASDFGRTLTSNGDGSDHGWGNHHFVAGGGVKGRNLYGQFPITALNTSTDVGSGRLLPTTSVTEFAATLGGWMGLTPTEQAMVLPNLGSFGSPQLAFA
ncbi:MAG: DUF1501 domain-containing protein [Burkholderiaceae bacterium]|nr:DUF1501 domain-containing protein [Burkholderiaceae bacterium]